MKILFTSIGRRVELVQAFKEAADRLEMDLTIYGTDASDDAPALFFCDRQIPVCRINNPDYITSLKELCQQEKIDALIPTIDTDLLLLSQNKHAFGKTLVFISDEDKIAICRDKRLSAQFFAECKLKTPIPIDDMEQYFGPFPCFIKPVDGSSSINAYKVKDSDELRNLSKRISDYIIQPFIDGTEYTIDAFCDLNGNPIFITPRERVAVRSGEVLKTRICQDQKMIEACKLIIDRFKPCGAITVQLIREKQTGDDYFIEINPRYGGGAPLSIKAGADSAEALLQLIRGENLTYQTDTAQDGAAFSRFDQSVCVACGSENISAIVFDLDDTLYSEKDYVMSGFCAVESAHPYIRASELWEKFVAGQPAFDEYPNKSELLALYREHKPTIHLYAGIVAMLKDFRERGYKIGIITDGRPEGQRNKIAALGLESLIDEVIVTDELGLEFRKPNDVPFRIMQARLHIPFEQMIYVGDNYSKDFQAPRKLGMRCVWIDNSNGLYSMEDFSQKGAVSMSNGCASIKCITDLSTMPFLVRKFGGGGSIVPLASGNIDEAPSGIQYAA